MYAKALGLLGLPALFVGGLMADASPTPAGKTEPCCGGVVCVEQTQATPKVVAQDNCPPCPPCPPPECPPCPKCP
jgi:hypothetical protein